MYDIVFLSYHEPHAQQHWELLKSRFPRAKHVAGVKGIPQAHRTAAQRSKTKYFWVVDADNLVNDDFDFSYKWPRDDVFDDRIAVWRAHNNLNGLEYGYGGIKLLPRQAVLAMPDTVIDFTTSISTNFHIMDEVASTTVINASPFEAWKAGFRECAKLTSGLMRGHKEEMEERAALWIAKADPGKQYSETCVMGAIQGVEYGTAYAGDPLIMKNINDWEWLHDRFSSKAR